jgi:secreted trypsin-like serine protease
VAGALLVGACQPSIPSPEGVLEINARAFSSAVRRRVRPRAGAAPVADSAVDVEGAWRLAEDDTVQMVEARPVESEDEFPGVGALVYDDAKGNRHVHCSAVSIGARTVLTAAHCLVPSSCWIPGARPAAAQLRFVTGPSAWQPLTQTPVQAAIIAAHFDGATCANDLAMLTMAAEVPRQVGAPTLDDIAAASAGDALTKVGYGIFSPVGQAGATPPGVRAAAEFVVADAHDRVYTYTGAATSGPPAQMCRGDSGGPGFVVRDNHRRLVGVTSWGEAYGGCGPTTLDTALVGFVPWIESHSGLHVSGPH